MNLKISECIIRERKADMRYDLPVLKTNNESVNKAFRIAYSDIISNIVPAKSGLLDKESEVIYAGMGYESPWTRDTAINVSNCCGLLFPQISKNTLLSVINRGNMRVGGDYWDSVIWILGAWNYYLCTGDEDFLKSASVIGNNTLKFLEDTEFDENLNLFRGQACYGDGVSAYPDIYSKTGESHINEFPKEYPELCADKGVGIPMHTLSTNCLYYQAYKIMAQISGDEYERKAVSLKKAINKYFWIEDKGYYRYIKDDFGNCDFMEGIGESFAVLFGVADERQTKLIMENQYITPNGIACAWPPFERYTRVGENEFGRHSGTVWPHIQAFWADAAARNGYADICGFEFDRMTEKALRDGHFAEIYHPTNGSLYGGVQEKNRRGIVRWDSQIKQTWSATGYIRIILFDIFGIRITKEEMTFQPKKISGITEAEIRNISFKDKLIDLRLSGGKTEIVKERMR